MIQCDVTSGDSSITLKDTLIISNEMVLCMLILFSIKILQQQSLEGFHFRNIYWHLQDSLRKFPLIPYILTPSDCHTNRFFNLKAQLTILKIVSLFKCQIYPLGQYLYEKFNCHARCVQLLCCCHAFYAFSANNVFSVLYCKISFSIVICLKFYIRSCLEILVMFSNERKCS